MPGKKPVHDWKTLRARFVEGQEWTSLTEMTAALKKEQAAGGPVSPSFGAIQRKSKKGKWFEQRLKIDHLARERAARTVIKREAAALVSHYDKTAKLGDFIQAMAAQWLKNNPQGVATLYEALAAARVGSTLTAGALEGVAGLAGLQLKPPAPSREDVPDAQGEPEARDPEEIRATIEGKLSRLAAPPPAKPVPEKPEPGGTGSPAV